MNFIVTVPEKVEPFLHLKCVVVSSINLYFTWVNIWFSFKKIKCSFCQQDRLWHLIKKEPLSSSINHCHPYQDHSLPCHHCH